MRANERTDERVAQYSSLYSWLFSTIVPPPISVFAGICFVVDVGRLFGDTFIRFVGDLRRSGAGTPSTGSHLRSSPAFLLVVTSAHPIPRQGLSMPGRERVFGVVVVVVVVVAVVVVVVCR